MKRVLKIFSTNVEFEFYIVNLIQFIKIES